MGLLSSKSSSSQQNFDQRQVASDQAVVVGSGATVSIESLDQQVFGQMVGAIAETQADSLKAMTEFGTDLIKTAGYSAAEMFGKSSANSAQAWGHTLDNAQALAASPEKSANSTLSKVAMYAALAFVGVALFSRWGK